MINSVYICTYIYFKDRPIRDEKLFTELKNMKIAYTFYFCIRKPGYITSFSINKTLNYVLE